MYSCYGAQRADQSGGECASDWNSRDVQIRQANFAAWVDRYARTPKLVFQSARALSRRARWRNPTGRGGCGRGQRFCHALGRDHDYSKSRRGRGQILARPDSRRRAAWPADSYFHAAARRRHAQRLPNFGTSSRPGSNKGRTSSRSSPQAAFATAASRLFPWNNCKPSAIRPRPPGCASWFTPASSESIRLATLAGATQIEHGVFVTQEDPRSNGPRASISIRSAASSFATISLTAKNTRA